MKNFVQPGETITLTAPAGGVVSGGGYLIGGLFVVAVADVAVGLPFEGKATGVFDLPKTAAQAWAEGDYVYWDPATAKADNTGALGNLIGVAAAAAANPTATGRVRLNGTSGRGLTPLYATSTVAATGTVQADAAVVSTGLVAVTAADATKGVKLPAAAAGKQVLVKNTAAAILKVWPATGDAINAGAANASYSMAASTAALFVAYDDTTWYSLPLVAS